MIHQKGKIALMLLLPTIAYLVVFIFYPLVETCVLAFSNPSGPFENFRRIITSGEFWKTLRNTLVITGIVVPLQLVLGLALALFVNTRFKGYLFILYIIAIPLALSDVSAALMSYSIFASTGFLNKLLMALGWIERPLYFFGFRFQDRSFWVIVITEIWRATPLVFIILLAGLQAVNKEYLEAANVFGFSPWQKLRKVVLPILRPSILSALLIRTIFAFQVFGVVWILAGRDIPILAGEAYYWQTVVYNSNVSSAYGLIIAVVTILISWAYITFFKPKDFEEGAA
jgi:multiple sugar transport system permease protein